jgi:hypothetical protein
MLLSLEATVFMVEHVFRCGGECTEEVKQNFVEMFPESRVPRRKTVRQMIEKFRESGSVAVTLRSLKPRDKVQSVSDRITQSPSATAAGV